MRSVLFIAFLIFTVGSTSVVYVFYNLRRNEEKALDKQLTTEARYTSIALQNNLGTRVTALERMAQRWVANHGTDSLIWSDDAWNYYEDQPGYQAIEYIDSTFNIKWIEPVAGNESVFGLNISFEEKRRKALMEVQDSCRPVVSSTIDLVQGNKGFITYVPIHDDSTFYGLIAGVFNLQNWLEFVIPEHINESFGIHFLSDGKVVGQIVPNKEKLIMKHHGAHQYVSGDLKLEIVFYPTRKFTKEYLTVIPVLVLIFGLIVSLLFAWVVYNIIVITKARRREARSNRRLEIAYQRLAYKNKEAEHLTYIVSHDLMEPVRTLTSFMELLQKDYSEKLDDKGKQYIQFMQQSSERMQQLIRGLLDYSRIGMAQEYEEINMNELVAEVVTDLDGSIREHNAKLDIGDLPEIYGNRIEIRLLLQNLIGNAIKYRRQGIPPEISVSGKKITRFVQFCVRDNGIGIPADQHNKVFKIFQRLHNHDSYEGTGIGLAHCQKVIESHGGSIWFESVPGRGTTFFFTVPQELLD